MDDINEQIKNALGCGNEDEMFERIDDIISHAGEEQYIALANNDSWVVRLAVAMHSYGKGYVTTLALERDEDERVRETAIERHAEDFAALATFKTMMTQEYNDYNISYENIIELYPLAKYVGINFIAEA